MRFLVIIPASGTDGDLLALAEQSVRQAAPDADLVILRGAASHGAKLDLGRRYITFHDLVVTLDSDVVVWPGWREWIERTLADPLIVACGAPRVDDAWGLHPSMLAMSAERYRKAPSWSPSPGQDTGVAVCRWLEKDGYLQGAEAHNPFGYWQYWNPDAGIPGQMWWHLGSGSASRFHARCLVDREAWGRWRRRAAFVRAARERLAR